MSESFTIRILAWPDARPLAHAVRDRVFIEEQGVPRELEWDEWDARSEHALACDAAGRAIGTARLLPDGRIGRMAVLPEWRRRGVGAALVEAMLAQARGHALPCVTLHAQTHAAGFYRRFGFNERGGEFLEAGIPHVEMLLELLPAPPSADS
jgi:predicted GNAT family N-acyltransferase